MLARFLQNHVLANLLFVLVLVLGTLHYALILPRAKDPEVNFNWVSIITVLPGASAEDVERRVTDVLERGIAKVGDIDFVSSQSRNSVSSILVRFEEIDERTFDRRINDLRREVRDKEDELPEAAEDPQFFELTSSNAFPTATLVVTGLADDDNLRRQARDIEEDLERLTGIDRVDPTAMPDPELQVLFDAARLADFGLNPTDVSDSVASYFRDLSAGKLTQGDHSWNLRWLGTDPEPAYLAGLSVVGARGEIPLANIAEVRSGRERADKLVRYRGEPAIMLALFKKPRVNTLDLLARVNDYIDARNRLSDRTGVRLVLADDQTETTRHAIDVMQRNALLGLLLVFVTAWLFLGSRVAALTTIGIPFTLAGTFWVLANMGETLNTQVLLGTVIALGMLVDDAVVVVEGIYYRIARGMAALDASLASLREVFAPVTASVLTTMAAFLPLMLLPGILGDFMRVIPMVVTIALAISLIEAYWMLPAHVIAARTDPNRPSRLHARRERFVHALRHDYARVLIWVMRRPKLSLSALALIMAGALSALMAGKVHVDFFALESYRIFYVNVTMPAGTPVERTLATAVALEKRVQDQLQERELRAVVTYAGQQFTETEPLFGERYGQIMISLVPQDGSFRSVEDAVEAVRAVIHDIPGPERVTMFPLKDGPPTTKPISVKVRGDAHDELRAAAGALADVIATIPGASDISDDAGAGAKELNLRIDADAARRAGIAPTTLMRTLVLLGDGEVVTDFQHQGDEIDVRVRSRDLAIDDIERVLQTRIALPDGRTMPLAALVQVETRTGQSQIRHYNFRRAITVEAELDKARLDTVTANRMVMDGWAKIAAQHPNIDLDFKGELDDVQESIDAIAVLFLFGIGLIYLILGTQFRSYFQPLLILVTVPMAFSGVIIGLIITGHPLSLYTLYGVVALAGISVNSAIVLISAANQRLEAGMSVQHATVYAARRRVVPILITTLTTIAGLFSLATGLGGQSQLWGPVATAIVWGLGFSTLLTLFVIPLLYRMVMSWNERRRQIRSAV
ncbi:MAG: efflux RND transporter permease subunit [Chromatiales bacterium]|nr:efflux RND transporter permease subunit [Gammaproteobacteria bacterium]MCP5353210.1 efflux RND transporter permease subunit [Chromatiales bacterium]